MSEYVGAVRCLKCGKIYKQPPGDWNCVECGGMVSIHMGTIHVESAQQTEPNERATDWKYADRLDNIAAHGHALSMTDRNDIEIAANLLRTASRRYDAAGGQQSLTLEQVREAFDAQLVVDARIPPEVESAFGAYVTQLRDRVIGWLETAGLSDMERE